jgi:hypothetical protein
MIRATSVLAVVALLFWWQGLPQAQRPKTRDYSERTAQETSNKRQGGGALDLPVGKQANNHNLSDIIEREDAEAERNPAVLALGMRITSNWAMVALTGALVVLTLAYVIVACRQVKTSRSIERAWIVARPMDRSPTLFSAPGPADGFRETPRNAFGVSIHNMGRTPARILSSTLVYIRIDSFRELPAEPTYGEVNAHDGLILVPNGEPIGRVAFLFPEPVLSKEQAAAVTAKRAFVYAYGVIKYLDVFGCLHSTQFGYVYNFPQAGEPQLLKGFMPGGPAAYNRAT